LRSLPPCLFLSRFLSAMLGLRSEVIWALQLHSWSLSRPAPL
jgi:hypothetical protein